MLSPKESGILDTYFKNKAVSAAQSKILLTLLERIQEDGFILKDLDSN